jgi:hypothetical protein
MVSRSISAQPATASTRAITCAWAFNSAAKTTGMEPLTETVELLRRACTWKVTDLVVPCRVSWPVTVSVIVVP